MRVARARASIARSRCIASRAICYIVRICYACTRGRYRFLRTFMSEVFDAQRRARRLFYSSCLSSRLRGGRPRLFTSLFPCVFVFWFTKPRLSSIHHHVVATTIAVAFGVNYENPPRRGGIPDVSFPSSPPSSFSLARRQGERRRDGNLDTRGSKIVSPRSRLLDLPRHPRARGDAARVTCVGVRGNRCGATSLAGSARDDSSVEIIARRPPNNPSVRSKESVAAMRAGSRRDALAGPETDARPTRPTRVKPAWASRILCFHPVSEGRSRLRRKRISTRKVVTRNGFSSREVFVP